MKVYFLNKSTLNLFCVASFKCVVWILRISGKYRASIGQLWGLFYFHVKHLKRDSPASPYKDTTIPLPLILTPETCSGDYVLDFYSSSKFVSKPKSSFVAYLVITSHYYLRGTGLNHVETRISGHIFWLLLPISFDRSSPARIVSFSDTIRRAKCHVFILTMIVDWSIWRFEFVASNTHCDPEGISNLKGYILQLAISCT